MKKYSYPPISEQLKKLGWNKKCKCTHLVNFYGLVIQMRNEDCRAHDSIWKRITLYLKRIVGSGR